MRVLLIAVPLMDRLDGDLIPIAMDRVRSTPPLGLYELISVLRAAGHEAELLDLIAIGELDAQLVVSKARAADLVGLSTTLLNWPSVLTLIRELKAVADTPPIVVGGVHATAYAAHIVNTTPVDFVLGGEGEHALLYLLSALRAQMVLEVVPGICFSNKRGSTVHEPPNPPLSLEELCNLPLPAYDLLPTGVYETLAMESSRGCAFRYRFCSTKDRGRWRPWPAEVFLQRLEGSLPYLDRMRTGVVALVDDLFTFDHERTIDICSEIVSRGLPVTATLDARTTDIVRDGTAEALEPITDHMFIGAECGYDEGLKRIRKGSTVEIIERGAAVVEKAGLAERTVFSFIIGFPFETKDDCMQTIYLAAHLFQQYGVGIYLQWYNTIPGSELWEELAAAGRLDIQDYDDFGFFTNRKLFLAGVRLTIAKIQEIADVVNALNTLFVAISPNAQIMQFARPEWLWAEGPESGISA